MHLGLLDLLAELDEARTLGNLLVQGNRRGVGLVGHPVDVGGASLGRRVPDGRDQRRAVIDAGNQVGAVSKAQRKGETSSTAADGRITAAAPSVSGVLLPAVNVPWGQAVKEDGTFKSAEDLKKLYASAGVDGSKPIITYCRIGERSSHTWFALSKILGYSVKNYDGSWTEYGNSVGVPINNPAGTVWAAK
mgnify:CR=1 FL=1